jgi:hypothetical protein
MKIVSFIYDDGGLSPHTPVGDKRRRTRRGTPAAIL